MDPKLLLGSGDTDVLRDATSAATVFFHRARHSGWRVPVGIGYALLVVAGAVLMFSGASAGLDWATPENLGVWVTLLFFGWLAYVAWCVYKFMPGRNDRIVLSLRDEVRHRIDVLEERMRAMSDDELRAQRKHFDSRLKSGESLEAIRPEVYACVREASRRARNHRQFECQLIGSNVLERCNVAEMRTGEGKTIVCYAANFMKVLQGQHVHMVTVNDYLVKRDAEFCRPIFELLGVTVGYISADMPTHGPEAAIRRAQYQCDITYGTNSEFGFDFLRDNMKTHAAELVQGPLNYAVVDEVDSILIDEARTPLIISGPAHDDVRKYQTADSVARSLIRRQEQSNREMAGRIDAVERDAPPHLKSDGKFKNGIKKFRSDPFWLTSDEAEAIGHMQYFVVELDRKQAHMTEHGAKAAQQELGIGTFYDAKNMNWPHLIDNALRAHTCYQRDKEYVIQDDQVIIVDEFTGRLMQGRQWSDGLHQAVEAKERVTVKQESQTLATITLQNFFKLYRNLAGMTGTALTEADEFMKIYRLEVVPIPTNRPIRRIDFNDKLYQTLDSKYDAIVEEIRSYSFKGYPADPWSMFDMLRGAYRTLAARIKSGDPVADPGLLDVIDAALKSWNEGRGEPAALEEAFLKVAGEISGGRPVLVGTTSVENSEKLSQLLTQRYGIEHEVLNAKNHAREAEIVAKAGQRSIVQRGKHKELHGHVTIATNMAGRGTDIVLGEGVAPIGGLHVVGTERHEARRIDNQLRGRCGRQGDPGSTRFFLSLQDELLRLFMGEWVLKMLSKYAFEEGVPIEHKSLTRGIERAQKKVEERNFGIRKNLLEYDEVPDQQRKQFYAMRQRIVLGERLSELIWEMIDEAVADAVRRFFDPQYPALCAAEWCSQHLGVAIEAGRIDTSEAELMKEQVRDLASSELRGTIQRTFGEYIDPDLDPEEWDVRGMVNWAAQYGLDLRERDVRETDATELLDRLISAALTRIEQTDLTPLEQYVDPQFGRTRLVRWAQEKFGVAIDAQAVATAQREEAEHLLREKMREAYRQREVEYPVRAMLEWALQRGGTNALAVFETVCRWANRKFNLSWTYERFDGKSPQDIFIELREINRDYLQNGKLDQEIQSAIASHPGEKIFDWAQQRFGICFDRSKFDDHGDLVGQLKRCGYEMLRFELTQLEKMVLLQACDAVWKDHMYSMDLLRHSIGLRGYAERDPKIEFKREGTRIFNETMASVRERVTDLIFKVQVALPTEAARVAAPEQAADGLRPADDLLSRARATHADATGAGFATAARDRAAAMRPQGEAAKPQTFRHEQPKVGRNDPCPCGSGKKYKQCCGKAK